MSDTNIVREVEEELRRERIEKLWQQYGPLVLAVAAAIIALVGGYKGWQAWQASQAAAAGSRFEESIRLDVKGKPEEAAQVLSELEASAPAGYATLAALRAAALAAEAGKREEAVAAYDAIIAASSTDPTLKSYARIAAASLLVDKVDSTEIENRLKDLDAADQPWRHSAHELMGLAAFRAGALAEAERHFTAILADVAAPQGARRRADMMMALIAADQAKPGG